jgi:hypothetical protein
MRRRRVRKFQTRGPRGSELRLLRLLEKIAWSPNRFVRKNIPSSAKAQMLKLLLLLALDRENVDGDHGVVQRNLRKERPVCGEHPRHGGDDRSCCGDRYQVWNHARGRTRICVDGFRNDVTNSAGVVEIRKSSGRMLQKPPSLSVDSFGLEIAAWGNLARPTPECAGRFSEERNRRDDVLRVVGLDDISLAMRPHSSVDDLQSQLFRANENLRLDPEALRNRCRDFLARTRQRRRVSTLQVALCRVLLHHGGQ